MWGQELYYLGIATGGIITILSLILMYLILRKAIENKHKDQIDKQRELYSEPLFSYIMNPELNRKLIPTNNVQVKAVELVLSKYQEILEGTSELQNLYMLAERYLSKYYRKQLKSRSWSKRINALHHIEDFNMRSLLPEVKQLISRENVSKEEKIIAFRILAYFEYISLQEVINSSRLTLSEFEYRSVLMKASNEILEQYIMSFHQSEQTLQKAVLDVLALKRDLKYVSFAESLVQSYSGEIRLRALKTLASIGYVKNIEPYLKFCTSSHWQERMMLAKLIGSTQYEQGVDCLIDLLHDPTWWVRSQAAQSINNYPEGIKLLKRVFQTSTDPFARDMALEWINKGD
jgi:hypothetical protein